MISKIFLIALIILAVSAINTPKLRRAVIYLGIFSLISSLVYLFYGAPDVAIAAAVIGSTITTVLFLVALKKYRVYVIYYGNVDFNSPVSRKTVRIRGQLLNNLEKFLIKQEIEPHVIMTTKTYNNILETEKYDLVVYQDENQILVTGRDEYHLEDIEKHLLKTDYPDLQICFGRCFEYEEYNT